MVFAMSNRLSLFLLQLALFALAGLNAGALLHSEPHVLKGTNSLTH